MYIMVIFRIKNYSFIFLSILIISFFNCGSFNNKNSYTYKLLDCDQLKKNMIINFIKGHGGKNNKYLSNLYSSNNIIFPPDYKNFIDLNNFNYNITNEQFIIISRININSYSNELVTYTSMIPREQIIKNIYNDFKKINIKYNFEYIKLLFLDSKYFNLLNFINKFELFISNNLLFIKIYPDKEKLNQISIYLIKPDEMIFNLKIEVSNKEDQKFKQLINDLLIEEFKAFKINIDNDNKSYNYKYNLDIKMNLVCQALRLYRTKMLSYRAFSDIKIFDKNKNNKYFITSSCPAIDISIEGAKRKSIKSLVKKITKDIIIKIIDNNYVLK